jgi:hypothetical protein
VCPHPVFVVILSSISVICYRLLKVHMASKAIRNPDIHTKIIRSRYHDL